MILDRGGRLGENWRPRWDTLRLFTRARFDGLPGLPFRDKERAVTKDQMSEYPSSMQSDSACRSDSGLMFSVYRRMNVDKSWSSGSTADLSLTG